MDVEYAATYQQLYEKHWWWRARENLILSTIERIRPKRNWGAILDVGCGDGLLFDCLREFGDVEGVEMNPSLIRQDSPWRNQIYVQPFDVTFQPHKRYSLILILDVLEHLADPLSCLQRALDLLDSEGVLMLTVPAFPCLWTSHDELNQHLNRYTMKTLTELVNQAGIRVDFSRYFFQWLFLVKLFVRVGEALYGYNPKSPKIPVGWINKGLYELSMLEQKLFDVVPVPFGSSLILVGGKP